MTDRSHDATLNAALDWFMRVQAAPADESVHAELDAWLARDDAHRKAYRKAAKVWKLTGSLPSLGEQPSAVPTDRARRAAGRARFARRHVGALAAIIVLFMVALPWLEIRLRADYHTGIGQTQTVSLADGSRIHLNANSAIAVDLGAARRSVRLLRGEAFFEVAPDATRPFTVNAPNATVNVLGTAFDVRILGEATDVAVKQGVVSILSTHAERLTAGDVIRVGTTLRQEHIAPQRIAAWRDGRLIIEGATAGDVVEALSSYHRGVLLLDSNLRQRQITGVFDLHRPEAALEALATSLGADVQFFTPWVVRIAADR